MGEKPSDTTRESILRNVLRIHARFCKQPEQGHIGKFIELVIADLAQQPGPFGLVHGLAERLVALLDIGMLVGIDDRLFRFVEDT
jgi:hypothetical protein